MNVTEQGLWAREIGKAHQSHIFHWTAAHFRKLNPVDVTWSTAFPFVTGRVTQNENLLRVVYLACSTSSQGFSVNAFRWRIREERPGDV